MIKINYRKYTDEEIAKVKALLKDWKPVPGESINYKLEEIANAVGNTTIDQAQRLAYMVRKDWKEFGTAQGEGEQGEPEINLITYGDKPSETMSEVAIHEMGHAQAHLERPDLDDPSDFSSFLHELIAFHYALYKQGNRERFNHQVEGMRDRYNKLIEHDPKNLEEMFDNKSFDEMMRIADYIATKDLKAKKKMGKPKPYFSSKKSERTAQTSLKGVR